MQQGPIHPQRFDLSLFLEHYIFSGKKNISSFWRQFVNTTLANSCKKFHLIKKKSPLCPFWWEEWAIFYKDTFSPEKFPWPRLQRLDQLYNCKREREREGGLRSIYEVLHCKIVNVHFKTFSNFQTEYFKQKRPCTLVLYSDQIAEDKYTYVVQIYHHFVSNCCIVFK